MPALILKPGREKSLLRRHPWIYSGAVERVDGDPAPGSTLELLSHQGQFLARAAFSPSSQIRARVWTFDPSEPVDEEFFLHKIISAIRARMIWQVDRETSAYRLIHAESDGLPGLIVDRYGDVLVVQYLSAGAEYWRNTIAGLLLKETGLQVIFERSDADVRKLEGLSPKVGVLRGDMTSELLTVVENELKFRLNIATGHKTGFYLDQRCNRNRVRELAAGREVLDCFCYSGGFSVSALAGEASSVLSVDASADALALCKENVSINALPTEKHATLEGDVFVLLRRFRDEGRLFDMVILDPPKFAPTAAQVEKAARGYKDINLLGFKLLKPGGILVTFSCSGGVDAALFQKIVASAALDAGVEAKIMEYLFQAPDHPVVLQFPEGAYLKGLVCLKG